MNVLIAGSTGFIGSNLVSCLRDEGYKVTRLVRTKRKEPDTIYWNPEKGELDNNLIENFDVVINLCGESIAKGRWTQEKKQRILSSRVKTTQFLAEKLASLRNPPQLLINASAVGYYGNTGDKTVREDNPSGTDFLATVCREWEAATEPAVQKGIRVACLRFGLVLSQEGGMLRALLTPFKWGLGGVIGSGKQFMSLITIDDLMGVMLHVIGNESISGPVNAVTPNPVTNYEFTKTLGKILNRPTVFNMPTAAAQMLFGVEKADLTLLSSVRASPHQLKLSGYSFLYPELEGALKHLLRINENDKL